LIVLGGGHETTYGHFLGYAARGRPLSIENIDAHADVRPLRDGLGHSGSPFRQALEHPSRLCQRYRVEGLQPSAVAEAHLTYLSEHGARFGFRRRFDPETLYDSGSETLATFCLDAVDQAFAPGVSAPATDGLFPSEWLRAAYRAGACPHVTSADVVELNPNYDRDGQTARLAARTVWEILRGLATRAG
jgi:formiminoglutamase